MVQVFLNLEICDCFFAIPTKEFSFTAELTLITPFTLKRELYLLLSSRLMRLNLKKELTTLVW